MIDIRVCVYASLFLNAGDAYMRMRVKHTKSKEEREQSAVDWLVQLYQRRTDIEEQIRKAEEKLRLIRNGK